MYQQRKNGGFRMRASFPISPEEILAVNAICERTGMSFAQVCRKALAQYIALENMPLVPEDAAAQEAGQYVM